MSCFVDRFGLLPNRTFFLKAEMRLNNKKVTAKKFSACFSGFMDSCDDGFRSPPLTALFLVLTISEVFVASCSENGSQELWIVLPAEAWLHVFIGQQVKLWKSYHPRIEPNPFHVNLNSYRNSRLVLPP